MLFAGAGRPLAITRALTRSQAPTDHLGCCSLTKVEPVKPDDDWRKHFHADGRMKDPRENLIAFAFSALAVIFIATVAVAVIILTR